ncbi:mycothiol transferase [Paeniglutamicibacter cryotolerans]|uniref:DinB-like domain-containing protein n=1 Tax=Paeniglutamicibacter cryotolerans TaxID=670079 RepID=A0A839QE96_9MICC|nr:DinB family protein [Paeniglutamicibacter cryotolerans]MBB2993927.1 hypothetical protein [Paeniglutamicibacter cryotolerans]
MWIATELLLDGFGRIRESVNEVLEGADGQLLLHRPGPRANSVGWLLWHLTRVQDDHMAGLARALGFDAVSGQCWGEGGWDERFALPYGRWDTGYGHSEEEVAGFCVGDPGLLAGYHERVQEVTTGIVRQLTAEDYVKIVDARFTPQVSAGVRLISVLNETGQHIGQAAYAKGIYLARGGSGSE